MPLHLSLLFCFSSVSATGDVTNSLSTASTTATSSTSTSVSSWNSQHDSIHVTSSTSSTGSSATSTSKENYVNVAEKDLGPTASTDDVVMTTGASGGTNRRQSAHHGSMTFVVDLGNNSGPRKEVDERAAAKLELLQRRSTQRSRSIDRGERNESYDDVMQDSVRTLDRSIEQ